MIVTGANQTALVRALEMTNEKFGGNLIFREIEQIGPTRNRFTLTVKSSKDQGARIGHPDYRTGKQRRIKAACWHVHGQFFDNLFSLRPDAVIRTGDKKINAQSGNWSDWNIGSWAQPMLYSDACHCDE